MSTVEYECQNGYATITLNRPDAYNALNPEMVTEVNEAIRRSRDDEEAFAIIVTGAGKGFCSGADMDSMPDWGDEQKEEYAAFLWSVQNIVRQLRTVRKPTVAAVNGPAIGGGSDIALACDVRYVSENAVFGESHVRVGLVSAIGGGWLLPRLVGESAARRYLLTGKKITPDAAVDLGLAVAVTSDPMVPAVEFAETVRDLPAEGVRYTNQFIDPQRDFETHCERAIEYQWECVTDPEHDEALQAFRDGRDPDYEGES